MKQLITGILAHVDAGKTTLSEGLLYASGSIRKMGKVDTKDAFLDTNSLERARGITIFSKQARLQWNDTDITILDTPGHVDFSAEMERVLQVLDYAILVVSGADGIQGHTQTLWHLLKKWHIPVFIFVNKMDQQGTDRDALMEELKKRLDAGCVDFTERGSDLFWEETASCDEDAMEYYFEHGDVPIEQVKQMIAKRQLFPVLFGSALKYFGVEELLETFTELTLQKEYPQEFAAKVFKITRDEQGNRLTHLKVTGGVLKTRDLLSGLITQNDSEQEDESDESNLWQEKVNQIRVYSGEKFEPVQEVAAGGVCAVTGLTKTYPGEGLGAESGFYEPTLEPVLSRAIILPEDMDAGRMLPKLLMLAEEQPELHIVWDERIKEIQARVMGAVQIEILQSLIESRFGVKVDFGPSHIVYKETIAAPVEGVGHFEPLRHYAEVHLLMEPLPSGSGLVFDTNCSEDLLDKNWQRLILTHLEERKHRGVLTRSMITDMKITVVAGRAHQKHTCGGDFRQATYRAVRQGLMEAESILLEPYYDFRLEIPESQIGRAMMDIEQMNGHFTPPYTDGERAVIEGYAPVSCMQDYKQDVIAYTKGFGSLTFRLHGYEPCHNQDEVVAARGYNPENDYYHTGDSVFCAHGSGYVVPWYEVKQYMHVESPFAPKSMKDMEAVVQAHRPTSVMDEWIGVDEVDAILEKTYNANSRNKPRQKTGGVVKHTKAEYIAPVTRKFHAEPPKEEYLLVDGYNIIHAWDDLRELAAVNMDSARDKLLDELCNYQGYKKMELIAVFDAYRVVGHKTEFFDFHNIHVVYTKEAETADQYIERFAHTHSKKYNVTVATSDGLEQVIIRGEGCRLLSARDFKAEMDLVKESLRQTYLNPSPNKMPEKQTTVMEKALEEAKKQMDFS